VIGQQRVLSELCLASAEVIFIEKLTSHAGAMSRSDDAVIASVTRDDLADVGEAFVRRLQDWRAAAQPDADSPSDGGGSAKSS